MSKPREPTQDELLKANAWFERHQETGRFRIRVVFADGTAHVSRKTYATLAEAQQVMERVLDSLGLEMHYSQVH